MSKLNPEEVGKIIGVFKAQIDVAIDVGHPSAGIHPQGKTKNGLVWQQRYANGDTDPGRLSATVIEHIRAEQVVCLGFFHFQIILFLVAKTHPKAKN
jgi:hypothetical protein